MAAILVVDDNAAVGRLIALRLGRQHDREVVENGQDAVDRVVAGGRFDVIFCDLNMPIVDGLAVHSAISRIDPEQARRIVFVTAGTDRFAARLGKLRNRILMKPFTAEDLRAMADSFLPIGLGSK
jgi:CheY-like chemotaxis protein